MTVVTLALLVLLLPFTSQAPRVDPDPLSHHQWTHRLLVIDVPDSESGRATMRAFRTAVEQDADDMRERDLLIVPVGDLPRAGQTLQPAVALDAAQRAIVRRRLQLDGAAARLVLIGKDGGVKGRQSGTFDLAGVFALIDTMPMRRSEARRPLR